MSSGVLLPSGLLISASQRTLRSDTLQALLNQQPQRRAELSLSSYRRKEESLG